MFLFLLISSILLRGLSFFYTVIDHDESTYLIIANELNKGAELYKDITDTKPAGIFILLSFFQLIFGKSIVAVRLFGAIILSASAFFFYRIYRLFSVEKSYALLGSLLFIIVFSLYRFGLAFNTEIVFTFFTISAIYYLLLSNIKQNNTYLFVAGLVAGLGFIIKYLVVADFFALTLFLIIFSRKKWDILLLLRHLFLLTIGFILPFVLINLYFFWIGNYDVFFNVTFEIPSNYIRHHSLIEDLKFVADFHIKYLPILFLFYLALFSQSIKKEIKIFTVLWFVAVWLVIIIPGKNFEHYYLQLVPEVCFILPFLIEHKMSSALISRATLAVFSTGIIIASINQSFFWYTEDHVKQMAMDLEGKVQADDLIYSDSKTHLVYYLLNLKPPSQYVHPSLIFQHKEAFSLSTENEMNKVLDLNPKFLIYRRHNAWFEQNDRIKQGYSHFKRYGKFDVLVKNDG